MRCGIDCVLYLLKDTDLKINVEKELEKRLYEEGISMYAILEVLHMFHISAKAYQSFLLPKNTCILFLNKGCKHYVVLYKKSLYYAFIYDSKLKQQKIAKWKLYFLWSHKYIVL